MELESDKMEEEEEKDLLTKYKVKRVTKKIKKIPKNDDSKMISEVKKRIRKKV